MNRLEFQLELLKFDESIANAERQVVQAELQVAQLKYNKARFHKEYGEAAVKAQSAMSSVRTPKGQDKPIPQVPINPGA